MWERLVTYLWEHHRGKVIGIALGLLAGILIVAYGFWKSLFIIICIGVGYLIGKNIDDNKSFDDWIQRIFKDK